MKKLTEAFNKATVAKGEVFSIELDSNPSTGYSWDMKLKAGKATLVGEDFISSASNPEIVGASGKEVFVFQAEEAGVIKIEGQYKRPWENRPPLKLQRFSVAVK